MIVNLNQRSTITVPAEIRHRLGIEPGDPLELTVSNGTLTVSPVAIVPRKLHLSTFGKKKEAVADKQVKSGKLKTFGSAEKIIKDLNENRLHPFKAGS